MVTLQTSRRKFSFATSLLNHFVNSQPHSTSLPPDSQMSGSSGCQLQVMLPLDYLYSASPPPHFDGTIAFAHPLDLLWNIFSHGWETGTRRMA